VSVTVGAENFDQFITDFKDRNVERSSTKVEDADLLFFFLVESISQSSGGWFVDDTSDFQACDLTSVFGRLALSIVEVRRNGDDSLVDFVTKVVFSSFLQLAQNQSRRFPEAYDPCRERSPSRSQLQRLRLCRAPSSLRTQLPCDVGP
jgi:hypothetical protein